MIFLLIYLGKVSVHNFAARLNLDVLKWNIFPSGLMTNTRVEFIIFADITHLEDARFFPRSTTCLFREKLSQLVTKKKVEDEINWSHSSGTEGEVKFEKFSKNCKFNECVFLSFQRQQQTLKSFLFVFSPEYFSTLM